MPLRIGSACGAGSAINKEPGGLLLVLLVQHQTVTRNCVFERRRDHEQAGQCWPSSYFVIACVDAGGGLEGDSGKQGLQGLPCSKLCQKWHGLKHRFEARVS